MAELHSLPLGDADELRLSGLARVECPVARSCNCHQHRHCILPTIPSRPSTEAY